MFRSLVRQVVNSRVSCKNILISNLQPSIETSLRAYIVPSRVIFPLKYDKEFRENEVPNVPDDFRFVYPDFIPDPDPRYRNKLKERIEREDMLCRRNIMEIPEFHVGSILAVTVSDQNASGKLNRFVGICMTREGSGLYANFVLRNVVDNLGVEILYDLYCPLLQSIEVLRLEKRLDDDLTYLRDCLPEYSTFPFDMQAEPIIEGVPVPINTTVCKLKPRPWHERWERKGWKGLEVPRLPVKFAVNALREHRPWEKFDLMKEYRAAIPEEEQAMIYRELKPHMPKLEAARRRRVKISLFKDKK